MGRPGEPSLREPSGLALSPDGLRLVVADPQAGLFALAAQAAPQNPRPGPGKMDSKYPWPPGHRRWLAGDLSVVVASTQGAGGAGGDAPGVDGFTEGRPDAYGALELPTCRRPTGVTFLDGGASLAIAEQTCLRKLISAERFHRLAPK